MQKKKLLFLLACFVMKTQFAFAAEVPDFLPGSVQPGLIGQQVPKPSAIKAPPAAPAVSAEPKAALPPAAEKIKFKLNKLIITGATIYTPQQLEPLYRNYVGKEISLVDLQTITDNITKHYREDGYLLSKAIIPAQKIVNGVVTLQVIEGYISSVVIEGNPRGSRNLLAAYGKHLTEQRPINISTLERYVLLANDMPGLDIKTILSPAKSTSTTPVSAGATQATLIPDQHIGSGYFGYDNRGTMYLGPYEFTFGGSLNSILRSGDQTNIQGLVTTNVTQLQYYRLTHQTPLGSDGMQLNIAASYSGSKPGNVDPPGQPLGTLGILGLSTAYSGGISYPLIRSRAESLFLTATMDASNSVSNINPPDNDLYINLYNDRIRSVRAGGTFSNADSWRGVNQIGTQLSQGLPIFNFSPTDQTGIDGIPTLSRTNGHSVYTKVNLDASRLQWLGPTNFSLFGAMQGQYALFNRPLLVAEQFAFGGAQFGQAYDPSQFTGDNGVAAKVELRYDQDVNWRVINHLQYFGYYDIGQVWNILAATPGVAMSGTSTGFGIRAQITRNISGYAEWTQPLNAGAGAQLKTSPRIFFGITIAADTPSSLNTAAPITPAPQVYQPVSRQLPAVKSFKG